MNKPILQGCFLVTHVTWKHIGTADTHYIIYTKPFAKFRLDMVMANVTEYLSNTLDYKGAEYLDRDRMYCLN